MSHKYVLLKEVCEKASSNIAQKDLAECDGIYPIYGASGYIKSVDFFQQAKDYIAIVKDGAGIGRAMKLPAKSSVIGTMQYVLPKDNINISYLYYAICSMHLEKYFSGATIPHIYFRDYQNEQLPLPTLEEQAKIANVFGRIDYFIKKEKEQLINLDKLVKSRFIEMFGDLVCNPFNWEKEKLGNVLVVQPQNGIYKPQSEYVNEGGHPILRIDGFYHGKVLSFSDLKRLRCSKQELDKYGLRSNDIVINRVNSIEYLGKSAVIDGLIEPTVFESNMMRMHPDEHIINSKFMVIQLLSKFMYNQILRHAKKAVNQASINQKDVQDFDILLPPIELQNSFVNLLTQVDKSKFVVTAKFQ